MVKLVLSLSAEIAARRLVAENGQAAISAILVAHPGKLGREAGVS